MKKFGLSKAEKIKREKEFTLIFSKGNFVFSDNKKIKATYLIKKQAESYGVMIAVAVPKKAGKAVWRNRIKRLLRESYRQNKQFLFDHCREKETLLKIIFSPYYLNEKNNKTIALNEVMPEVVEVMIKIKSYI